MLSDSGWGRSETERQASVSAFFETSHGHPGRCSVGSALAGALQGHRSIPRKGLVLGLQVRSQALAGAPEGGDQSVCCSPTLKTAMGHFVMSPLKAATVKRPPVSASTRYNRGV